ncbi:Thioredoxin-like 3-2, chloroplastic [Triticum urartu]|uniref:Thioredoxin-like 3-2, chloroplastic n=1 Tax=Triticum urartu TaxID=4572 RepID=M7ZE15_TRIUA|nr:Thioredoxin-like 3-2, chloroplastic [Triticum urartu]
MDSTLIIKNSYTYCKNLEVIKAKYYAHAPRGIDCEEQLDRALAEAQQRGVPIVVFWTASWCRKCIYLKPKLEKLAAEYYRRIRFYCVDVNAVPQKLVNRAGVTMWSDSRKQAEVIGGHESWMVIEDVRRMVEQEE